uniref:Uncharacterized protein n=1 Tax=Tanacetum cinerariifolium TaxID=118510 RepID=A0A699HJ68_TANCI|nr:hypothetical protein [Tanacetum cinerariifolium]
MGFCGKPFMKSNVSVFKRLCRGYSTYECQRAFGDRPLRGVYVPGLEHPEYHVPSDDDMQVKDQPYADDASSIAESPGHTADSESMDEDSIDYPDKPEDDDEDSEEDPEEDHTDYSADGGDGDDEPTDDDDDDFDDEDEEPTEDEDDDEGEEEHLASTNSSAILVVDLVPSAEDTKAFKTDESAPTPRPP